MNKEEFEEMLKRFEQICQNAKKELCAKEEKDKEKKFIEKINKELTITEYDEIKHWLSKIKILDNADYILNSDKAKKLLDYITNLQEQAKGIREERDYLFNKLSMENKYLQERIEELEEENISLIAEIQESE